MESWAQFKGNLVLVVTSARRECLDTNKKFALYHQMIYLVSCRSYVFENGDLVINGS